MRKIEITKREKTGLFTKEKGVFYDISVNGEYWNSYDISDLTLSELQALYSEIGKKLGK